MPLRDAANIKCFIQNRLSFLFSRKSRDAPGALIAFVKSHLTFECNVTLTGTLHRAPDSK